jgi:hypothetical protein
MAKKNAIIEEPVQEEAVVETPIVDVEETVVEEAVVEAPVWTGYPSRDFHTKIEGVPNGKIDNAVEDGGQEQA